MSDIAREVMRDYNTVAVATLIFILVLFVLAIHQGWIEVDGSTEFIPTNSDFQYLDSRIAHIGNVQTAFDSTASMLLTIHVALFVLVGFVVNLGYKPETGISPFVTSLLCAFVAVSFVTLYLGFVARFQALERANAGYPDFSSVADAVALQGMFLCLSAILAIAASAAHLTITRLSHQKTQTSHPDSSVSESSVPVEAVVLVPIEPVKGQPESSTPQARESAAKSAANATAMGAATVVLLMASFPTDVFAASEVKKRPCMEAEIANALNNLPDFIELGEGQNEVEAISIAVGCDLGTSNFRGNETVAALKSPAPALTAAASMFSPTGRISVRFQSKPPGANVYRGSERWGATELRGSTKLEALREIRMELAGYQPCSFDQGQFNGNLFYCVLSPANAK